MREFIEPDCTGNNPALNLANQINASQELMASSTQSREPNQTSSTNNDVANNQIATNTTTTISNVVALAFTLMGSIFIDIGNKLSGTKANHNSNTNSISLNDISLADRSINVNNKRLASDDELPSNTSPNKRAKLEPAKTESLTNQLLNLETSELDLIKKSLEAELALRNSKKTQASSNSFVEEFLEAENKSNTATMPTTPIAVKKPAIINNNAMSCSSSSPMIYGTLPGISTPFDNGIDTANASTLQKNLDFSDVNKSEGSTENSSESKNLSSNILFPENAGKEDIQKFIQDVVHMKLSESCHSSISFGKNKNSFQLMGRPPVTGLKGQGSHVNDFGALVKALKLSIINSTNQKEAAYKELNILKVILQNIQGYATNSDELSQPGHERLAKSIPLIKTKRSHITEDKTTYLMSPRTGDKLYSQETPRKTEKAQKSFPHKNIEYVDHFLSSMIELMGTNSALDDHICETLARITAVCFNKIKNVSFAKKGNSPTHELRFKATKTEEGNGEVMTARELYKMNQKTLKAGELRLVDCEGPNVTKDNDAIELLWQILEDLTVEYIDLGKDPITKKIQTYNDKYNFKIKLENTENIELQEFNKPLIFDKIIDKIPTYIAKHTYRSFGLKALPDLQLEPDDKGNIKIYLDAEGTETNKFKFVEGKEHRSEEKRNLTDKKLKFCRNPETDSEILPEKLANSLVIKILPYYLPIYNTQETTAPIINKSLKKLSKLASIDYDMSLEQSNKLTLDMQSECERLLGNGVIFNDVNIDPTVEIAGDS